MSRDECSIVPDGVSVRFRGRRCTGTADQTVPMFYTKTVSLSDAGKSYRGISGTTKWFHDAALALFDVGNPDPTNQSTLDTLAERIAKDYISFLGNSFDEVFSEVIAPTPDALTDLIEWTYRPKECQTRRMSGQYNADPEELYHHDPINANCKDSGSVVVSQEPCIIFYGPPGICVGGKLQLTRYKVCLTDALLIQTYISTDQM